ARLDTRCHQDSQVSRPAAGLSPLPVAAFALRPPGRVRGGFPPPPLGHAGPPGALVRAAARAEVPRKLELPDHRLSRFAARACGERAGRINRPAPCLLVLIERRDQPADLALETRVAGERGEKLGVEKVFPRPPSRRFGLQRPVAGAMRVAP